MVRQLKERGHLDPRRMWGRGPPNQSEDVLRLHDDQSQPTRALHWHHQQFGSQRRATSARRDPELHQEIPGCRLVYYQSFNDPREAISHEKELKAWRRNKKNMLVENFNRKWADLSGTLYQAVRGPSSSARLGITEGQRGDAR